MILYDAVFISDLHLNPNEPRLSERFFTFIDWAREHVRAVYILGDFFHVWPGDEALDDWSLSIANALASLVAQGIAVYFMPGNRDFLLGPQFIQHARVTWIQEPFIFDPCGARALLVHGDGYCTKDWSHQLLRGLTRRDRFIAWFLSLPYALRYRLVHQIRQRSQQHSPKRLKKMHIVTRVMLKHMQTHQVTTLIHGHIHRPGLTIHSVGGVDFKQYVLSDWDDNPLYLVYNKTTGFNYLRG